MSSSTPSSHLTFPTHTALSTEPEAGPSSTTRLLSKNRLYVGNLHPTVDEYALLRLFSKFGKVKNLDFLFHKTGPFKGKPRGYAFVEYRDEPDALRALSAAHDKLLRGRKLVVTFAHQAPLDTDGTKSSASKKRIHDESRSTTLSLLKSASSNRTKATQDKIAALEAKLQQIEQSRLAESASVENATTSLHPSLPPKPSPSFPNLSPMAFKREARRVTTPLPPLPISPQNPISTTSSANIKCLPGSGGTGQQSSTTHKFAGSTLAGVRIKGKADVELKRREPMGADSTI